MLTDVLGDLQNLSFVVELRRSRWTYPLVNAGHILGIALLFGAIVPLDLRLLGLWRSVPIGTLSRVLLPVALSGLLIAIAMGGLLFAVRAEKYAAMAFFQIKALVILAALTNVMLLHIAAEWRASQADTDVAPPLRFRVAGLMSIGLWTCAIVFGRMIAYAE